MTIPEQLRALAAFIEEHGIDDDDIYSAEIGHDGGRMHLRIAPFRALTDLAEFRLYVNKHEGREGNTHHAAKTASGGLTITLTAVTRPDEDAA